MLDNVINYHMLHGIDREEENKLLLIKNLESQFFKSDNYI